MNILGSIPVHIETSSDTAGLTHNTRPLLHEIRHALERLSRNGLATVLDLRAIPFAPGDEERLLAILGVGEVEARLTTLGGSRIRESSFSGVWVVEHHNDQGVRVAFQIEITDIPSILRSQPEDIVASISRLTSELAAESASDTGLMD